MATYRWFALPLVMLGCLFIYDSVSYSMNNQIEGIVERVYIKESTKHDSEMAQIRFGDKTDSQSIGPRAFAILKPGDIVTISVGRLTGAWMAGDIYRADELIHKDLKLNRAPVFLIGAVLCLLSLLAFVPQSWLGRHHSGCIKRPLSVFGFGAFLGLAYYLTKALSIHFQ